jgi:murein DD-endopeptidase MepM/ murein hydrolase activator NlpD
MSVGALVAAVVILAAAPALARAQAGGTAPNPYDGSSTQPSSSPAPSTTAAPGRFGTRTLRRGARGADVRVLQQLLGRLRFPTAVDGMFGPGTERQVRGWERSVHALVDGVVTRSQAAVMLRRAGQVTIRSQSSQPAGAIPVDGHVFPVRGPHSFGTAENRFGAPRDGHTHQGQDILASSGTPLVAACSGRVTTVGSGGAAGNYLVIAADDNTDMAYMHLLSRPAVSEGSRVSAGQFVGRVGQTGDATTPHLHFELWTPHWWAGGHAFDPLPRLRAWDAAT